MIWRGRASLEWMSHVLKEVQKNAGVLLRIIYTALKKAFATLSSGLNVNRLRMTKKRSDIMGRILPDIKYNVGIGRVSQTTFGGIDLREAAVDGAIYDMTNMSGEHYPLLSPRKARRILKKLNKPNGVFASNGLIWVDGNELWRVAEMPTEIEALTGSGKILNNGTVVLDVDNESVFKEMLQIADRRKEVENAYLKLTYKEAGLPMDFYTEIADLEVLFDRKYVNVYASGSESPIMKISEGECRLYRADSVGAKEGTVLYVSLKLTFPRKGEVLVGTVEDSEKRFAAMGSRVVIFPDKKYLDVSTGEFGKLEATWSGIASIKDGTYGASPAVLNTIVSTATEFPFNAGDAVSIKITVSGGSVNDGVFIIRSVSADKKSLTFYENTFKEAADNVSMTISRSVPDLEHMCIAGGRLWGCAGGDIFASKLGDIFNFNCFDGISTDSWSVTVPTVGSFTGCATHNGAPIFFKENTIYKVYGTLPSEFQLLDCEGLGIDENSARSAVNVGSALFYVSREGIAGYTGSYPSLVTDALGTRKISHGVAGSDGVRYYLSCRDDDRRSLYVFDTTKGLWHREDSTDAVGFAAEGDCLYMLSRDGILYAVRYGVDIEIDSEEETVYSECIFAPYTSAGDTDLKTLRRITVRGEIFERDSDVFELFVKYDGLSEFAKDEGWMSVAYAAPSSRRSFSFSFVPRRCDSFSIKVKGRGEWRIHTITREYSTSKRYR